MKKISLSVLLIASLGLSSAFATDLKPSGEKNTLTDSYTLKSLMEKSASVEKNKVGGVDELDVKPISKTELMKLKPFDSGRYIVQLIDPKPEYTLIRGLKRGPKGVDVFHAFLPKDRKVVSIGETYDTKTGKQLLASIDMSQFDKYQAFTYGNGPDHYYLFTDPKCPFCIEFEKNLEYLKDVATFHVFLFPLTSIHPGADILSLHILAQENDEDAYKDYHLMSKKDPKINDEKMKEVEAFDAEKKKILREKLKKEQEIGEMLGVTGVPSIFDAQGHIVKRDFFSSHYKLSLPVNKNALTYMESKGLNITLNPNNNKEKIYLFTNTECPHCIKAYKEGKLDDLMKKYSVEVFLMATSHPSFNEAYYILSQPDDKSKAEALKRFMSGGDLTEEESRKIDSEARSNKPIIDKMRQIFQISHNIGVVGTPSVYKEDGTPMNLNK